MNPDALEGLSTAVSRIYADAQIHLITRIAQSLDKGLAAPDWAIRQLAAVNAIAGEARTYMAALTPTVSAAIEAALAEAAHIGTAGADTDVDGVPNAPVRPIAAINTAAVAALAAETVTAVTSTHSGILRAVEDSYRSIIADVTGRTITGVATRREVTQQALNKFADAGIGMFTDRAGRNWKLDTYAEMAVRTATLRTMHTAHTARLRERGYDLVVVSSHPNSAPVCRPYEGKILSLSGDTPLGERTFESARDGSPVRERVFASMAQAEAAGLHHPMCAHRHTLFVPGVRRPAVLDDDGGTGYADNQKLRGLERDVRQWKRRQAAAITPAEKARAAAKVREKQAAIRDHVDATGARRLRHREQLRAGDATKANDSRTTRPVTPTPDAAKLAAEKAAQELAAQKKAVAAAKRAEAAAKKRDSARILSQSTRDLLAAAKPTFPKDRAGWFDTTMKYPLDRHGAKLVPAKLAAHLDTTLTVGKAIRDDAVKRFDTDPVMKKLRAEDKDLVASGGAFTPRRNEITRAMARREQGILLETLAEVRPIGGVEQAVKMSTTGFSSATAGTSEGVAAVRRAEGIYPADWLRAGTARGALDIGKADRAFFNETWDFIAAPETNRMPDYRGAFDSYTDEVMAHELGHRMETLVPGLTQLEFALVRSRSTKNDVLEPQTKVYPGAPELADEVGYSDDWHNKYAGKTYANDQMADPARRAAEAFQVGIQDTFGRSHNTGEFDKSTQLQEFVIGAMALL